MLVRPPDDAFWAKLSAGSWHPLAAHLADVAAVAEVLVRPSSALSARLARAAGDGTELTAATRQAVVLLAFLHDVGKVQHGFQRRRDPDARTPPVWRGHVRPLLNSALAVPALRDRLRRLAAQVGGTDPLWTAICHHGRPYLNDVPPGDPASYWCADAHRDPLMEIDRLVAHAWAFAGLGDDPQSLRWPAPALHLLAGVVTLADWLGSSERFFPFAPDADADPVGYWAVARARAAEACAHVGLTARPVRVAMGTEGLSQLFPATFPRHAPTALQRYVAEMPLPQAGTRLLVESDTGSGKTEAALTLFSRLRAAGVVDSLFFALPTRATASAMYDRVQRLTTYLYPPDSRPAVELAVGGRQYQGATGGARQLDAAQYPDEPVPPLLARWTSQSTRHAMAAEIVVGTVDQALLASLAAGHAHLRLAGVARGLLVVDEVHAYDRYMTTVLRHLTDLHTGMGGIALFMSATLASDARAALGSLTVREAGAPEFSDAVARPFPSLSILAPGAAHWDEMHLPAAANRDRSVAWTLAVQEDALNRALAAARDGARVLVLRNTVREARETLVSLETRGGAAHLWRPPGVTAGVAYHARYTRADRALLDDAVLHDFGPGSTARGVVLIATQVAEQSLDLDFDLLVSDLAPVDVLVQRLGRLHRHQRLERGAFAGPSALVIEPRTAFGDLIDQRRRTSDFGHGTVYGDLGDLELTRRLIAARPAIHLPQESRDLVEAVYHPRRRADLGGEGEGWARHLDGRDGDDLGAATHAEVCVIRFDQPYTSRENVARFGGLAREGGAAEAQVRTRLGDDRIRIQLIAPVPNAFATSGGQDQHVDLDARVLRRSGLSAEQIGALVASRPRTLNNGVEVTLGPLTLRYDVTGWSWISSTQDT
jgi:CRISPR-associated endonuclease/helicase Cas3